MNTVWLKQVEVGAGRPKVVVPIVGTTREEILSKGRALSALNLDVVEWRMDFYEEVEDTAAVLDTLADLAGILKEIPILATFRTRKEGGERELPMEDYMALNLAVGRSGHAAAVDVEIFSGDAMVEQLVKGLHAAGTAVVGSSHEFGGTPSKEELVGRLCKAQELGCDILKAAVMPKTREDVLTLLSATGEMCEKHARQPVVTMSMGALGVVSRLCSEAFGSTMTFGAAGQVSAPGQVQVEELNTVLDILHRAMERR